MRSSKYYLFLALVSIASLFMMREFGFNQEPGGDGAGSTAVVDKAEEKKKSDDEKKLRGSALYLNEIVVTGTREGRILKDVPVETGVITRREIEGTGIQTVTDAVRWMPGVDISGGAPYGASQRRTAVIHGLPAQYSLVLLDGRRIKSEHIHTGINIGIIPIHMVERIEVVKGPLSAQYGSDAFGGVMNIITRAIPASPFLEAEMSYGSYNTKTASAGHGATLGNLGYFVNLNYTESDGVVEDRDWHRQGNGLAKATYALGPDDRVYVSSFYYANRYLKSGVEVDDREYNIDGGYEHRFSSDTALAVSGYHVKLTAEYAQDENVSSQGDFNFRTKLFGMHRVALGGEARRDSFERTATPGHEQDIFGGYVQDEITPARWLTVLASLRADIHDEVGTVLSPMGGILLKPVPITRLRATAGRGFRAPSLQELYEYHYKHGNYYRDGNEELKPEYSINYSGGIEQDITEHFTGRVGVFYNTFEDLITVVDTGEIYNTLPVCQRVNISEAMTRGVEAEGRFYIGDLDLILGYTYLDSRDDKDEYLSYNPKHMYRGRLYYDLDHPWFGFKLMISVEHARDRYYRDKSGAVEQLENYTMLGAGITKRLGPHFSLFIRGENLLDQEFTIYDEGNTQTGFGRTWTGGMSMKF